jgi:hypothetical protein
MGTDVYLRLWCVYVEIATCQSPIQGVLPESMNKIPKPRKPDASDRTVRSYHTKGSHFKLDKSVHCGSRTVVDKQLKKMSPKHWSVLCLLTPFSGDQV